MDIIKNVNDINLSTDFKLQFGLKHQFEKGTFEQKYIDHFCNGDKLTNMDEFISSRLHYQEFGIYSKVTPNSHPNSQWMKFWKEEKRRCIEGYNIGRDWIPGYLYFYWNYTPIWRVEEISQEEGSTRKRAKRVFNFPDIYDSDYHWFHYIEEAEKRGMHCSNIKKRGIGYEQPHSETIISPTGKTTMGEIQVDDFVIDRSGNKTKVLEKFPQGNKDIYSIKLKDGRITRCGLDHLWTVEDRRIGKFVTINTKKILEELQFKRGELSIWRYAIPPHKAVEYSKNKLTIPPYLLGLLLGDGTINRKSVKLATDDIEIIHNVTSLLNNEYTLLKDVSNNNYLFKYKYQHDKQYNIKKGFKLDEVRYGINPLRRYIDDLNLNVKCFNKFIPEIYKTSSIQDRLELIKGLIDSDGHISKLGAVEFSNKSITLCNDLMDVLRSVGIKCKLGSYKRKNTDSLEYRIYIYTNEDIAKLPRKLKNLDKNKQRFDNTPIISITKEKYKEECSCIMVDNLEQLYLTNDYIPTHNSFKGGSMMNRNYFLIPGSKSYAFADQKEYLIKDGILTKAWELMDWIDDNTAWTKRRLKKTEMHKKSGFEKHLQSGAKIEAGYKSEIIGVTLEGDSNKARGKRGKLILWEESGNNKALRQAWVVARNSMEEDDATYGLMIAFGTGGTEGANFEGLEELIRRPEGYNIYGIPNIFENKNEKVGFFVPTYLNRRGCMDSQGNSNIIKAVTELDLNRKMTRRNMSANIYLMTIAEHPYTIDEAVLKMEGSPFDVATIKAALGDLVSRQDKMPIEKGSFYLAKNENNTVSPMWRLDLSMNVIDEHPWQGDDTIGGWIMYEKPQKTNGSILGFRYLAGNDPIDWGSGEVSDGNKHSFAATYILDTLTRNVVAEYVSRPEISEHYYEQLWRGIEYYNAELLYENNLKGLFTYFKNKNKLHLLAEEPLSLRDLGGYKMSKNPKKGFHATAASNKLARDHINVWSLEDVVVDQDEDGNNTIIPRMFLIRSKGLLQEMIAWNSSGNFDRISGLGAAMILLFDRNITEEDLNRNKNRNNSNKLFEKLRSKMIKKNKSFKNTIENEREQSYSWGR